jgi:tRNA U34 2-thiouridine synthase MnmA/TrmU
MGAFTQIDLSQLYWTRVFEPALDDWSNGLTPNPDISCNRFAPPPVRLRALIACVLTCSGREIKFGALLERALMSQDQWLATGSLCLRLWIHPN